MGFQTPLLLLGLLLVPVAAVLYARDDRRRERGTAAFAAPAVLASAVPRRPGWRRHAPMALYAVALAGLLTALARPQTTVAVGVEQASIMLATDVSGSMQATDVPPTRLAAAKAAERAFLAAVPRRIRVGALSFNQAPQVLRTPTTDRAAVQAAVDGLRSSGGTATGEAIAAALTVLERQPAPDRRRPPAAIVLLSDGKSVRGRNPLQEAQRAARLHIPIYTVALGTASGSITVPRPGGRPGTETRAVPPDAETLQQVARTSGGKAFVAGDAGGLEAVYRQLGSRLAKEDRKREVTAAFAGGSVLLLLAGGLLSLRWFGRLP